MYARYRICVSLYILYGGIAVGRYTETDGRGGISFERDMPKDIPYTRNSAALWRDINQYFNVKSFML